MVPVVAGTSTSAGSGECPSDSASLWFRRPRALPVGGARGLGAMCALPQDVRRFLQRHPALRPLGPGGDTRVSPGAGPHAGEQRGWVSGGGDTRGGAAAWQLVFSFGWSRNQKPPMPGPLSRPCVRGGCRSWRLTRLFPPRPRYAAS